MYIIGRRGMGREGLGGKHSAVGEREEGMMLSSYWWEMAGRGNMICLESDLEAMMVDILVDIICAEDVK
jgi:hypothetical protein